MAKRKRKYKTVQGELILKCLKGHVGHHMTADEIFDELRAAGNSVGRATIYRHLERLCDAGSVCKHVLGSGGSASFEYAGGDAGPDFHVKCLDCGKLAHVRCDYMENLHYHLLTSHGFDVDSRKTVLYGICRDCAAEREG
jgi:Fur family ferric uptake transcriptional regulator